jgi:N6-L-threonylcarbamoyladenine synthase
LLRAIEATGIKEIAVSGGVSANSGLRGQLEAEAKKRRFEIYFPKPDYSTDNAAMVAVAGLCKFKKGEFADQSATPYARTL